MYGSDGPGCDSGVPGGGSGGPGGGSGVGEGAYKVMFKGCGASLQGPLRTWKKGPSKGPLSTSNGSF